MALWRKLFQWGVWRRLSRRWLACELSRLIAVASAGLALGWWLGAPRRANDPLDEAADWIRACYGDGPKTISDKSGKDWQAAGFHEWLKAVAVMNFVQQRVEPAKFGNWKNAGRPLPNSPRDCLLQGAGICGNQVEIFRHIARRLDLRNRSVQFYWRDSDGMLNSHIGVEVFYGDGWHYFDVTWGSYFVLNPDTNNPCDLCDALGLDQILALKEPGKHALSNGVQPWFRLQWCGGLNPFDYLRGKNLTILRGLEGTITHAGTKDENRVLIRPNHLPDFFGVAEDFPADELGNVTIRLLTRDVRSRQRLVIDVRESLGAGEVCLFQGEWRSTIPIVANSRCDTLIFDLSDAPQECDLLLQANPAPTVGAFYICFDELRIE